MKTTKYGEITISNEVIAELAAQSAMESYGIVGLARGGIKSSLSELIKGKTLKRGVSVHTIDDTKVKITLYVVIEFGVNLVEVSKNLVERIKYDIHKYTEVDVEEVEVIVKGVTE